MQLNLHYLNFDSISAFEQLYYVIINSSSVSVYKELQGMTMKCAKQVMLYDLLALQVERYLSH